MSKIASVTFSPKRTNVGGAQIPALAFKEWCNILGHECQAIGITEDVSNINISDFHTLLNPKDVEFLNGFDAIFFQTPNIYCNFDATKITKPFVIMLHDEKDVELYGKENVLQFTEHKMCKCLAHIDLDGDFFKAFHPIRKFWHPCTMPNNLWHKPMWAPKTHKGILYAARISKWKNPVLFSKLVEGNIHFFDRKAYMFGAASDGRIASEVIQNAESIELNFHPFELKDLPRIYKTKTGLFWDVCGIPDHTMEIKRMNLSAFEALCNGYMPIVNPDAIPNELRNIFIEINPYTCSQYIFRNKVQHYFDNRSLYWQKINRVMPNSYASYNSIKLRVQDILETLLK